MELNKLRAYRNDKLREIYREMEQQSLLMHQDIEQSTGIDISVECYWEDDRMYIMINPAETPEIVDFSGYISLDILPEFQIDYGIGINRRDLDVLRDNKEYLKDENIITYYEEMFELVEYLEELMK